jgi:hypothetical protein
MKTRFRHVAAEDAARSTNLGLAQQRRFSPGGDVVEYAATLEGSVSDPSGYDMICRFRRDNDSFEMWFVARFGASPNAGSGTWTLTLPFPLLATISADCPLGIWRAKRASPSTAAWGPIMRDTDSTITFEYPAAAPTGTPTYVGSAAPWAWTTSDSIGGHLSACIDRTV